MFQNISSNLNRFINQSTPVRSWCEALPEYLPVIHLNCEFLVSPEPSQNPRSFAVSSLWLVSSPSVSSWYVYVWTEWVASIAKLLWLLTFICFILLGPNKLINSVEHPLFSSDCKIKFYTHVWNGLDTAYLNEHRNAQVELLSNYTQNGALVLLICQLGKKLSICYGTWSYIYT
jgi:hypothetical protein